MRSSLKERRRKRRVLMGVLIVGGFVFILAALAGLSWLPLFRVTTIAVSGEKTISAQAVEATTKERLRGGYLGIFSKSNILLYPHDAIEETLLKEFPMFEGVEVGFASLHAVAVSVEERTPTALWCGETVASSSTCYLLDKNGIIYAPAVVYSGDAYQRYFGRALGEELPRQFLSSSEFRTLFAFAQAVEQKTNLHTESMYIDEAGDAHLTLSNLFTLIFPAGANMGEVLPSTILVLLRVTKNF
jgi:hypothetical protein